MPFVADTPKGFTAEEMASMDSAQETEPAPKEPEEGDGGDTPEPESEAPSGTEKPQAAAKAVKPPPGYVPQAALHEERRARKEAKEKADKYEALWTKFLNEQKAAKDEPKKETLPALPSFDDDPAGHLHGLLLRQSEQLKALDEATRQRSARDEETAKSNQMLSEYANAVSEYTETDEGKTFEAAYRHLYAARDKELAVVFTDPTERRNRMQWEEGYIAGLALQRGMNPGKVLHDMARQRGWQQEAQAGGDAAATTKLDRIMSGQKAAKSLNSGGIPASGANEELSLARMLELEETGSEKEIEAAWNKMRKLARGGR